MQNGLKESLETLRNDVFNACMHLCGYERNSSLKLMKKIMTMLLLNGDGQNGIQKKAARLIQEMTKSSNTDDVWEKLNFKTSQKRTSMIKELENALSELPNNQFEIIKQHYINDRGYEELGRIMKKNPGALRTMACRTMQKLREQTDKLSRN